MPSIARHSLGAFAVVAAATLGCAGTSGSGAPTVPDLPVVPLTPLEFRAAVAPFPVSDSAGRLLEAAFVGGFNLPRPQLLDADGDGDLDLFVQEVTGKIALFERNGERDGLPRFVFRTDKYEGLTVGQWYRFADADRDGDQDLLTEQPFNFIKYYRNDGAPGAPRFTVAADTLRDPKGKAINADAQNILQVADLDCDGRSDLLIGNASAGTVARYEALDSARPGVVPAFALVTDRFEDIQIIGEGNVDAAGLRPRSSPSTPRSPGPSQPPEPAPWLVPTPLEKLSLALPRDVMRRHGANTMALVDIDHDGDLDLIWGDFFEPGLLWIKNTGSCSAPNFRNTPIPFPEAAPFNTTGYNAPTFGDVNGDGKLDVVFGALGGTDRSSVENLYYAEQSTIRDWTVRSRQLLPIIDVGAASKPAVVDLDGDGDLDLAIAGQNDPADLKMSRIYWFENVGSKTAPALRLRRPLLLRSRRPVADSLSFAPAFGDLDGDGRLDMVLGKFRTTLAWYKQGEGGFDLADSALARIPRGQITVPTLGDLDGDGDLDMLVGESSGWINFYRNKGSRTKPRFVLVSETFDSLKVRERSQRSAPHLADLDGDGDLDLLVGYEADGVVLYRNVGSRTVPRFVRDTTFAPEAPALASPAAGDFDGDGDLDLVVGSRAGGVVYFERR